MIPIIAKSPDPVCVIEHPIRGGWTLCLAHHEATDKNCFCWWAATDKRKAIEFADQHYANVIAPPPPLTKPGLCHSLRSIATHLRRP